jgi:hypothetical protein
VSPISVNSAAAWTAVRRTGNSVLGSGRSPRFVLGTPRGCAGCASRFGLPAADLGFAGASAALAAADRDFEAAGALRGDFAAELGRLLARGVERADVAFARLVFFAVGRGSWRVACCVSASGAGTSRAGRLALRRWGRERGSALSRSEERSSVIRTSKRPELASNLKRISQF